MDISISNRPALFIFALMMSFPAIAEGLKPENVLSLSGFGTAGLTHNSTEGAEFIRDILQPQGVKGSRWSGDVDSRIGLQATYRPNEEITAVVQGVSYYSYQGNYDPELTWAFLSYAPQPGIKLRIGRLGWDVYMLSDTRNVGYSYLWVRPPVDYFGQLQVSHLDGGDVVLKHELGVGIASLKLYAGRADQTVPTPPVGTYDASGSRVLGANLDYQTSDWLFRAGYTAVRLKSELPAFIPLLAALRGTGLPSAAALANDMAIDAKTLQIVSLGAVWEHGPWQAQLMFNRLTSNTVTYPTKDSGYFLLGYRRGNWTPFVTISGTRSEANDRSTGLPTPNPLDDAVTASLAAAQSRQYTFSVGTRFDFMRNADLKIQVDRVQVLDHATFLWRDPQSDWNGRATIFSLALDFVF
jgi:hypothetical protein